MSELELVLADNTEKCTMYTIHFLSEDDTELEKFITRFKDNAKYNSDFQSILVFMERIMSNGALERYFRREGKMSDSVVALPVLKSRLRLYCLRLSDHILVVGNGGVKDTRTYEENDELQGYVMTLQKFERMLKREAEKGNVEISETEIKTDLKFDL
ncbi:MAG: hypothetical protein K2H72_02705 [Muribaculaceae bacterium]|nr:hypothetical protein [Muribaculaceae bacterium]